MGVPFPGGDSKIFECPLHAESRAASIRRTPSVSPTSGARSNVRHPSAKSVHIQEDDPDEPD